MKPTAVVSWHFAGRTHLYISWEGEVLPEGVTLEAVVCQNTPQVWVVGEEHSKHVPYLYKHTQFYSQFVYSAVTVKKKKASEELIKHRRLGLTSLSYQLAAMWTGTAESTGVNSSVYVLMRIREL